MGTVGPGVPGWVDLGSPDMEATKRFYSELFGWTAHVSPLPEAGGYVIFTLGDKPVAGAGPLFTEDQPSAWSTYVITDDADAIAAKVGSAGGKVLAGPFDVMEQGRMAAFLDQAGAPFSVWQPGIMGGAEVFNEPGSLSWNELTTRDPAGAKAFYGAVFGWTAQDTVMGPVTYTTWHLDTAPIGGMMPMTGDAWPADLPPHWTAYFAVADTDASAARVTQLGGTVSVPPTDIPQGRMAVVSDQHGAHFSIIALSGA